MTEQIDHAGLEVLSFGDCLRRLASVPVGRIGFIADGEVVILPVNHAVDGQNLVFRTGFGSKLSSVSGGDQVTFEADSYDASGADGWSVVVHGYTEVVEDDREEARLGRLGLRAVAWGTAERPFWVRIRPLTVTGRQTPRPRLAAAGRPRGLTLVAVIIRANTLPGRPGRPARAGRGPAGSGRPRSCR